MKGTTRKWIDQKGFGFITGENSLDYFIHFSNIQGQKGLNVGDHVEFDPSVNDRGKVALNVRVVRNE